jgi:hypothetical protein
MGSRRVSRHYDAALHDELLTLAEQPDCLHARDRLWDIFDDHECWPGRSLVGADGEEAAWLVAQRAIDDMGLQRRALEYLEWAVDLDEADPVHLAHLHDRVRMNDGREQLYGSQFVLDDDGELVPWYMDDPALVEERRRRLGLPPLAEHAADMTRRWAQHRSEVNGAETNRTENNRPDVPDG